MAEMPDISYWATMQGALLLDLSRELRLRDDRKELFLDLLRLRPGMIVADLEGGPGAVTRKLASWLGPASRLVGVDKDRNSLAYARREAKNKGLGNVEFHEGDVLDIPLDDESVDACVSNTVIEHVPNTAFLLEQKRICRRGGPVSVMMAQPGSYIRSLPDHAPSVSEREKELRKQLDAVQADLDDQLKPGKYWPDPADLPRLFGDLGFDRIQVDAVAAPVVLDDSRHTTEEKMAFVDAQQSIDLEYLDRIRSLAAGVLPSQSAEELKRLLTARYDRRRHLIAKHLAIWDYEIAVILIVSGCA